MTHAISHVQTHFQLWLSLAPLKVGGVRVDHQPLHSHGRVGHPSAVPETDSMQTLGHKCIRHAYSDGVLSVTVPVSCSRVFAFVV